MKVGKGSFGVWALVIAFMAMVFSVANNVRVDTVVDRVVDVNEAISQLQVDPTSLADVVKDVRESVVHIEVRGFFGFKQGSGCIVGEDGLIFTARHVTENSFGDFIITLDDGRKYKTNIYVDDKEHDIAFLKIDPTKPIPEVENEKVNSLVSDPNKPLKAVKLGDLDKVRIGDSVFIMGSPLGRFNINSVTLGIVSAKHRNLEEEIDKTYRIKSNIGWTVLFQSDAGACPGNSGGPVFDMDGNVVGVLVAGARGYEVNYSVPIGVFSGDLDIVRHQFYQHRFEVHEYKQPTTEEEAYEELERIDQELRKKMVKEEDE